MTKTWITATVVIVAAIAIFAGVIWARGPSDREVDAQANLIDMQQSATAMQQAGQTMQQHAQTMLDEAQRTGDAGLQAHGQHWLEDGQALVQAGDWMAMNPTVPSSLVSSVGELGDQGNWGELNRNAQQMLHDPSDAREIDIEALRWNGEAMRAEGRNMSAHGDLMAEEASLMVEKYNLQGQAADDLRQAAQVMRDAGDRLQQNGQNMIDYAEQVRRSLGY